MTDLPHYANIRDGALMRTHSRPGTIRIYLIALVIGLGMATDPLGIIYAPGCVEDCG